VHSYEIAARFLRGVGMLLILLGLVHIAATPHIPDLLHGSPQSVYDHAVGPILLNHVLVGILLLPLGFSMSLAAAPAHRTQLWAKRVLLVNALAVLTLPVSIAIFMRRPEYYASPLFLAGTALVAIISMLTLAATVLVVVSAPDSASES